ncbi:MAG: hypothetical protein HUK09_02380 [Bacteroidaceae bacterium]|nr:hypothetical protein [Bacteroidaceae bacterium]
MKNLLSTLLAGFDAIGEALSPKGYKMKIPELEELEREFLNSDFSRNSSKRELLQDKKNIARDMRRAYNQMLPLAQ